MTNFFKIENFVLHDNYDHSFWFNGYTVYSEAEYEGISGMARNFPAGNALYLINDKISLTKEDRLNDRNRNEILHIDGSKTTLQSNPKFVLRYRDYLNESMIKQYNDNSVLNFQTASEYMIRRYEELKCVLKTWDRIVQIEAELIMAFWKCESLK